MQLVGQDKVAMLDGLKQQLETEAQEKVPRALPIPQLGEAMMPTAVAERTLSCNL